MYRDVFPDIYDYLMSELEKMLEVRNIKMKGLDLYFDLSHCQGDGVSFSGDVLDWHGLDGEVRQRGRYTHEYTMYVDELENPAYDVSDDELRRMEDELEVELRKIAVDLKKLGYDYIEMEDENA